MLAAKRTAQFRRIVVGFTAVFHGINRLPRQIVELFEAIHRCPEPHVEGVIACPWLVSRFINPGAEFIYVPRDQVTAVAEQITGIPYDIKGAEFGHVGDRCSFDAIVRIFDIKDPALDRVATAVRGADTSRRDLAPECEGLYAISFGLSANFPDDHEMLRHGLVIYDALYTWCRKALGTATA